MSEVNASTPEPDGELKEPKQKENNPFSEQEKHGDEAQRRAPGSDREYRGDPSVQRRAPGAEEDIEEEDQNEDSEREIA